jgi:hypothetical protein
MGTSPRSPPPSHPPPPPPSPTPSHLHRAQLYPRVVVPLWMYGGCTRPARSHAPSRTTRSTRRPHPLMYRVHSFLTCSTYEAKKEIAATLRLYHRMPNCLQPGRGAAGLPRHVLDWLTLVNLPPEGVRLCDAVMGRSK